MGSQKKKQVTPVPAVKAGSEASKASDGALKAGVAGNEIDQIFSRGKAKNKLQEATEGGAKEGKQGADAKKARKSKKRLKTSASINEEEVVAKSALPSGPRNKTKEGFPVYTEDELGCNRKDAGGTDLCPFDCNCCF